MSFLDSHFEALLQSPDVFLMPDKNHVSIIRKTTKLLHDHCVDLFFSDLVLSHSLLTGKQTEPQQFGRLKSLVMEGFDAESIWSQLSLSCQPALQYLTKRSDEFDSSSILLLKSLLSEVPFSPQFCLKRSLTIDRVAKQTALQVSTRYRFL